MLTNLATLQLRPEDLLAAAITDRIDPASGIDPADLAATVVAPEQVQVVPTDMAYMKQDWMYYGHVAATYTRLDMEDVFGTYDLRLVLDIPSMASDLAALLRTIYRVQLATEDIVNEPIPSVIENGQAYVLKASPTSTMWKGSRTVRLYFSSTQPG